VANLGSQTKRFILIAEDDEDDRTILDEFLSKYSAETFHFEFVENGRELIDYLSVQDSHRPDLILLDLNMPLVDGREALKVIRSDPQYKDIPVVCFATCHSPEDLSFCLDHGATLHVKPALVSEFSAFIQSVIGTS
jgi:two-component system response regulator